MQKHLALLITCIFWGIQTATNSMEQEQNNGVNYLASLPKDVLDIIGGYLLADATYNKLNEQTVPRGINIITNDYQRVLCFRHGVITLDDLRNLYCTTKQQPIEQKVMLFKNNDTSKIKLNVMHTAWLQVVACNISLNKRFIAFLTATYGKFPSICDPVLLKVVDIFAPELENQKRYSLNLAINNDASCAWNKNRIHLKKSDMVRQKELEAQGYICENPKIGKQLLMINNPLALAVDNTGTMIAFADQTGIVLIYEEENKNWAIKRLVNANFSDSNLRQSLSRFKMGFDSTSTSLFYKTVADVNASSHADWKEISLTDIFQRPKESYLEAYFHTIGVCKKIQNGHINA